MLAPAFPEPVLASQAVFRAVMEAFARPGEIKTLRCACAVPPPLSASVAALLHALLDYETPVWLDRALSGSPAVAEWIRFNTGARVTADPQAASFAISAEPEHILPFETFSLGTDEYPDRSTTLVLQVRGFDRGERLSLSGPGIAERAGLSAEPLPVDLVDRLAANRALFPRGVDLILVGPDSVAALPRSVLARRG